MLAVDQPFPNHNGGLLLFGPDGKLYIGLGDGGSGGDPDRNGLDLSTLLGKILRIDPTPDGNAPYTVPDDNPFVGENGARPEIYSYGLRNPWRFSFDRETGDFSIGDVGQDTVEEIDLVGRGRGSGANFGWSAFEGDQRFNEDQDPDGAIPPVLTALHADGNCSITGGLVVRDRDLPTLYGRYLYGDLCAGELRSFTPRPEQPATRRCRPRTGRGAPRAASAKGPTERSTRSRSRVRSTACHRRAERRARIAFTRCDHVDPRAEDSASTSPPWRARCTGSIRSRPTNRRACGNRSLGWADESAQFPARRGPRSSPRCSALLALVAAGATAAAPADRAGVVAVRAKQIGTFDQPVFVTGPPRSKGLRFVVEKAGKDHRGRARRRDPHLPRHPLTRVSSRR